MSEFSDNAGSGYISTVEVENLQLREALVYAEQGWREALDLARKEQEKQRVDENAMEIKSLQLELQTMHTCLLHTRREDDAGRERLIATTTSLNDILEELIDCLGYRENMGLPPVEEGLSSEDDNLRLHLDRVDKSVKRAETILSFAREAHIKRLAKEEALKKHKHKKKVAPNEKGAHEKTGKKKP